MVTILVTNLINFSTYKNRNVHEVHSPLICRRISFKATKSISRDGRDLGADLLPAVKGEA